jgi:hypothetical protein
MSVGARGLVPPRRLGWTTLLFAPALAGFATFGTLPLLEGLAVALVAVGLAVAARLVRSSRLRSLAPVPPLLALAVLAVVAVPTPLAALYGGLTALALLLWLADDPDRLPGGPSRAVGRLVVPVVGFALAWTSSFLLPGSVAPVGAGIALLVAVVVLAALLLRRPELFDRDAAATS